MQQGYHFPPPDPDPNYGYGNPQLLPAQQWGQPQPGGYELAYQAYAPSDPGPFQNHQQQQGYSDTDPDYGDEYYEDEEPRRGKRWILIVVALVGAIGVGGALAYGYRSFVAPHAGRVPVVKADPNVKAKPDFRSGREFAGAEKKLPVRIPGEAAPDPAAAEEPPTENLGPRPVKSIPIGPGGVAAAPEPAAAATVPGITIYRPPQVPAAQQAPAVEPPVQAQTLPKAAQPAPPSRVAIGSRPQPAAEPDDDAPPAPVKRPPPMQTAAVTPKLSTPRPASSGLGYVAVLFTEKTSMDALKKFADMQQKYTDVLVDKTPDVQEADLSERGLGTQYRLVVGPPGSRNAASGVCAQLKSAGYSGCWVKEY